MEEGVITSKDSSNIVMGLDFSTQSLTVLVLEINESASSKTIYEHSIAYADKLCDYGIDANTKLLPSNYEGEANQPPLMFLDALDMALSHCKKEVPLHLIQAISLSAQQHGHVYLNSEATRAFRKLHGIKIRDANLRNFVTSGNGNIESLSEIFESSFSYAVAPIWMTTASQIQADEIRDRAGGTSAMVELSGSDSPARFTGAIVRRIAQLHLEEYACTSTIHLLSSFLSAVFVGREDVPIDWGNGSGMSLMNYRKKVWSETLLEATSYGLAEGENACENLRNKLPRLCSPLTIIGAIAPYFIEKFGFAASCKVLAGSGDNPQTKVAVSGDLLSLGTSFVLMSQIEEGQALRRDINAMYDGLGQPFVLGCRTNGALVWDLVRKGKNSESFVLDFNNAELLLQSTTIASNMLLWQPLLESFPLSTIIEATPPLNTVENDYPAIIDTSLAILHHSSKSFMRNTDTNKPLYVSGGASKSQEILRRIATFWNRPVIRLGSLGAAFGAALSAYVGQQLSDLNNNSSVEQIGNLSYLISTLHTQIVPQFITQSQAVLSDGQEVERAMQFENRVIETLSNYRITE